MALLPVDDAVRRILEGAVPRYSEDIPLADAYGRVLAAHLAPTRTQPPFDASAMDGYAVRAADLATIPAELDVVGRSVAGQRFAGTVAPGKTVRIFTGAPMPEGADAVLIQEDTETIAEGRIRAKETLRPGKNVRRAGLDFTPGKPLLTSGRRLGLREIALAAAMNHAVVPVAMKPRVAIIATGDELVPLGGEPGPDQIVASSGTAIATFAESLGAVTRDFGVLPDRADAISNAIREAIDLFAADVVVTLGGASVGDHDLVRDAMADAGMELDFWQIAMRPGKPLVFGRRGETRMLGLPGNPVSSLVCAILFLKPLILALSGAGAASAADPGKPAVLGIDVPANDHRQDYVRAVFEERPDGPPVVRPLPVQDSSMLSALATANCLLIRAPNASAGKPGDICRILPLP